MKDRNVVIGQRVSADKVELARQMRRDQTAEEKILWQRLRANRLGSLHFRRQQLIDGYIVDFYCHAAGLVVEVDGPVHHTQRDSDEARDQVLQGRGLTVLRLTNEEVRQDIDAVLQHILNDNRLTPPRFGEGPGEGLDGNAPGQQPTSRQDRPAGALR